MKVFIVGGAGVVGSSTAFCIARRGCADEIVLQDLNADMAQSHAMDMAQALFPVSRSKIRAGGWEEAEGSDLVIIAAGLPPKKMSRNQCENMDNMMPLVTSICEGINRYCPDAVVLSLTNPLEIFNYVLYRKSGLKSSQFIALSENDSVRFRWGVGQYLNVDPQDVECYSVGQHVVDVINLFSTVKVKGKKVEFSDREKAEIEEYMEKWWDRFREVSQRRTAGWTTGEYSALTAEHILGARKGPVCASVILEEETGLGYPVYLDRTGFTGTEKIELTPEEQERVEASMQSSRTKIREVLEHLGL